MKTPSERIQPAHAQEAFIRLADTLIAEGFDRAVFSSPRTTERTGTARLRTIHRTEGTAFQLEWRNGKQSFHRIIQPASLGTLLADLIPCEWAQAELHTTQSVRRILTNRRGEITLITQEHNMPKTGTSEPVLPGHDRTKHYLLAEGRSAPFLTELGIMTAAGQVIKSRYDKFRQINRFLEFIADAIKELDRQGVATARPVRIIDFGCGKSYLTFAVHHYLTAVSGRRVHITGLDLKADVITRCAELSGRLGCEGLEFSIGDIAGFQNDGPVDLVISLHACDTATDHALAQALRWGARVILAVPCCQHELYSSLSAPGGTQTQPEKALTGLLRHGIVRERTAALATDSMRAELLEAKGYRTDIMEFIDISHTPKNLLLRAIYDPSEPETRRTARAAAASNRYINLTTLFGCAPLLERLTEADGVPE